jgi:hypothetical protein
LGASAPHLHARGPSARRFRPDSSLSAGSPVPTPLAPSRAPGAPQCPEEAAQRTAAPKRRDDSGRLWLTTAASPLSARRPGAVPPRPPRSFPSPPPRFLPATPRRDLSFRASERRLQPASRAPHSCRPRPPPTSLLGGPPRPCRAGLMAAPANHSASRPLRLRAWRRAHSGGGHPIMLVPAGPTQMYTIKSSVGHRVQSSLLEKWKHEDTQKKRGVIVRALSVCDPSEVTSPLRASAERR